MLQKFSAQIDGRQPSSRVWLRRRPPPTACRLPPSRLPRRLLPAACLRNCR